MTKSKDSVAGAVTDDKIVQRNSKANYGAYLRSYFQHGRMSGLEGISVNDL